MTFDALNAEEQISEEIYEADSPFTEDEPLAPIDCPLCSGSSAFLGTLGHSDWFRCRDCGGEYHRER